MIKVGILDNMQLDKFSIHSEKDCRVHTYMCDDNTMKYHGTQVNAILRNYTSDIEVFSYIITQTDGSGDIASLMKGLEQCLKDKMDYVIMSIGTSEDNELRILYKLVKKLVDSGIKILASGKHDRIIYPAFFKEVIEVRRGDRLKVDYTDENGYIIEASGVHQIEHNGMCYKTKDLSSYSCPYVAALIIMGEIVLEHI
jgi:hypothetical protein